MGWVYQYWSTELKNEVYAKLAKGGKIEDPSELAAATALYTERYIVDYLVQNTLGATWVEMHPESRLPETWPYYVTPPEGNPPVEREPKRVRELTLIDPCVGSRPLPRPRLRPVRPALRRRGDRAARGRRRPDPRAQPLRRRHRPPGGPDRGPRPLRQGLRARRRRLPAAQAQPRRLRHRHPASTRPRSSSRASTSPSSRTSPGASGQGSPGSAPSARCSIRSARSTRRSPSSRPGARARSGRTTPTGRRSAPTS